MRFAGLAFIGCCVFAVAGSVEKDDAFIGARRNYWAFRPPQPTDIPHTASAWISNPIDAFILDALTAKKQAPAERAGREKLLRRLYLDVVGLPPTPDDLRNSASWEQTVDRLMAMPQYGERLALKWLDV